MKTAAPHQNSTQEAQYTVGIKTYKRVEPNRRVRMRQVKIYRNGAWIYCDVFQEEERAVHEEWAQKFLEAMKHHDTRQSQEQPEQEKEPAAMPVNAVQQQIWDNILKLRELGLMTNREAASICLVRFTWTPDQAKARLTELQERYAAGKRRQK